jgi:NADH-quinone oxidoreductase subunit M
VFGTLEKPSLAVIRDMSLREKAILVPLIVLTILFGIYPSLLIDVTTASVDQLIGNYQASLAAAGVTVAAAVAP